MFLVLIVLLIAPLTAYLPVAAMGGVILLVAYNLIDFHHIGNTIKFSRSETAILATTFFATLFLELEFAIYLGVLVSILFFLARTSTPNMPTLSVDVDDPKRKLININKKPLKQCPQLKIIRIDMSIYFGSVNFIQERIARICENERIYHIMIIASGVNFIDLAGAEAMVMENNRLKQQGGGLYFVGLKSSVYEFAAKTCFVQRIGNDHFFDTKTDAVHSIYQKLDKQICQTCPSQIFMECQ
jgi:SulP family sulfate permease